MARRRAVGRREGDRDAADDVKERGDKLNVTEHHLIQDTGHQRPTARQGKGVSGCRYNWAIADGVFPCTTLDNGDRN